MSQYDPNAPQGGNGNGSGGAVRQTTLREFSAILFRRKWIVIGLFAVTTATVAVLTLTTPKSYISAGGVYVKSGERQSLMMPSRQRLDDWEQALGTEMEIVKSEPVIRRAREILAAEADGGDTLAVDPGAVDAEVKGKSNVMAIGYVDADPGVARKVCNAVIRAYVEFRERDLTPAYTREFFETQMKQVDADLKYWTEMRRDFADRSGVIDVVEENRSLIGQLADLERRRSLASADLAEAKTLLSQIRSLADRPDVDLAKFAAMFPQEMSIVDLKRRVVDQEAQLAALRERLRDEAVDVVNAKKTLDQLKELLTHELNGRVEMATARVDQIQSRIAVIDDDIASLKADLKTMPETGARLAMMDRKIDVLKRRQQDLTEKRDQALVTENTSSQVNVMLLESAGPARPVHALDYVRLALAPAFSIVVGIGLAFFVDGLDLTVRTARHAEEVVELPVLATLTERRKRAVR